MRLQSLVRVRSVLRVIAALIVAALVPALPAALSGSFGIMLIAFFIALAHAVLLGLPLFLLLQLEGRVNQASSVGLGFAIGAFPMAFFTFPARYGTSSSVNGIPHVVNGVPTLAGWLSYLEFVLLFGGLGALGGLAFWLTVKSSSVVAKVATPADGGNGSLRPGNAP
jgi:hypothetical protein